MEKEYNGFFVTAYKRQGHTLDSMSIGTGIPRAYLSLYLNGKYILSSEQLTRLGILLNVDLS